MPTSLVSAAAERVLASQAASEEVLKVPPAFRSGSSAQVRSLPFISRAAQAGLGGSRCVFMRPAVRQV